MSGYDRRLVELVDEHLSRFDSLNATQFSALQVQAESETNRGFLVVSPDEWTYRTSETS
jgi:hypothetical protein